MKQTETARSANRTLDEKRAAATAHAAALSWTGDNSDIKGATILLVDDVFTSGSQLQHVALRLRATGAADVRGLVLARVPWSGGLRPATPGVSLAAGGRRVSAGRAANSRGLPSTVVMLRLRRSGEIREEQPGNTVTSPAR